MNIFSVSRAHKQGGFTIVELLIVIVVIAILAAITIVAYNGIRSRAVDATVKSDLKNAASQLENDQSINGSYPSTAAASNGGVGLKVSGSNTITYGQLLSGYCVSVNPNITGISPQYITSVGRTIQTGVCPPGNGVATTMAGSGTAGSVDGTGTGAQFTYPTAVSVDRDGNVYVAANGENKIRKITPAGVVTTIATGITNPVGIVYNPADNNIYTSSQNRIWRVTTAGAVSSFAGSGTAGGANGNGASAQFNGPAGLAVDSTGNIYVADGSGHRIRKVTLTADVSTIGGTGVAGINNGAYATSQFNFPRGVAVAKDGTVYVADYSNNRVRYITTGGTVGTLAGSGTASSVDGTGLAATFRNPEGIAVDGEGNVYTADNYTDKIRKIDSATVVTTLAGSTSGYVDATGTAARFFGPMGIAITGSGTMYIADYENHRIRKIE